MIHIASSPPVWCIIDLGTSTNSDGGGKTQFQRAYALLKTKAAKEGCVVITHWHADHIGGKEHHKYVKALGAFKLARTLDSNDLADANQDALARETKRNGEALVSVAVGSHTLAMRLIFPDFLAVAKKNEPDDNLCSLGVLLTISETMSKKLVFSFLTLGDMHPINEEQVMAVVGKTPINLLKFPHHGSKNNYFRKLFASVLATRACHVIISGYTKGESDSLRTLYDDRAASVTILLQDPAKAGELMSWAGFQTLAQKWGLRAWKDAQVVMDTAKGTALMTGAAWSPGKKFGEYATLGGTSSLDLTGMGAGLGLGGGEGADDDYDPWGDWDDANGELTFKGSQMLGVRYDDEAYALVPTEGGGQCFYRCCARFLHGDPDRCNEVRQALAATLVGAERERVARAGEFATFEDIEAMATHLHTEIVVHLSEMADIGQKVSRRKTYNKEASLLPLHVLFEYNPVDGAGHISTLRRVE